jgi:hypothetical protein
VSSRTARATQRNPVSKNKTKQKKKKKKKKKKKEELGSLRTSWITARSYYKQTNKNKHSNFKKDRED